MFYDYTVELNLNKVLFI